MARTQKIAAALAALLTIGMSAGYVLAQPKPGAGPKPGMMGDAGTAQEHACCMHDGASCPMHDLLNIAEIKVEKTKTGANLQLTAKATAKVAEVQDLAEKIASHMKAGGCPMMKGEGMHGHHHDKPMGK